MANDVHVTELDVVKAYNTKLNAFRVAVVACGVAIEGEIRGIKSALSDKQRSAKKNKQDAEYSKNQIVNRYKPIRREALPGSEVAGNSDYDIQSKYQALEAAVNDYNNTINQINDKISEIGQRTKTFCTIFNSEVIGSNRKLKEMIEIMDSMVNHKI